MLLLDAAQGLLILRVFLNSLLRERIELAQVLAQQVTFDHLEVALVEARETEASVLLNVVEEEGLNEVRAVDLNFNFLKEIFGCDAQAF